MIDILGKLKYQRYTFFEASGEEKWLFVIGIKFHTNQTEQVECGLLLLPCHRAYSLCFVRFVFDRLIK